MMQKIEQLLDLAIEVLALKRAEMVVKTGEELPLKPATAPQRKPRTKKLVENEVESDVPEYSRADIKDEVKTKRKCMEIAGVFIRKHQKDVPSGLDQLKTMMAEICGRAIVKFDDLTSGEMIKLLKALEEMNGNPEA